LKNLKITQTLRNGLNDGSLDEFIGLAKKLSSSSFRPIDQQTTKNLLISFNVINAAFTFVEQTLSDTSVFNFRK
jgi:hypothetical protein